MILLLNVLDVNIESLDFGGTLGEIIYYWYFIIIKFVLVLLLVRIFSLTCVIN